MRNFIQHCIEALLDTLNVMTGEVFIGLSPTIGRDKRNGVIHLRSTDGGIVHMYFITDNPEKLINPSFIAVRSLFQQVLKMGYVAEFIEITVDNTITVYKKGNVLPIHRVKVS